MLVKPIDISVVVPVCNGCESLRELEQWIDRVMKANKFSYQLILIDDGSSDESWEVIEQLIEKNDSVSGLRFRRNYGKSAALYCGFEAAEGEVVFTMDADLQDPPGLLPEMVRSIEEEGYDSIATRRVTRKGEPPIRSFFARCFYIIFSKLFSQLCYKSLF